LGRYRSTPNDFARDAEALNAPEDGAQPTCTLPMKSLKHFADFKGMSRVETPAMHLVVITKPGEVDTQKKTYLLDGISIDAQTISWKVANGYRLASSDRKDLAEPNRSDANLFDLSPIATQVGCQVGSIWVNSDGCARF